MAAARDANLFEIAADIRDLAEQLLWLEENMPGAEATDAEREAYGVQRAGVEAALAALGEGLEAKVDGYGFVLQEFATRAAAYEDMQRTFQRKRQVQERAAARLKGALLRALDMLGVKRVDGLHWRVRIQGNLAGVNVTDPEAAVAAGFGEIVTQAVPDCKAIIAAWKADPASVAAFAEVTQGSHVRIE